MGVRVPVDARLGIVAILAVIVLVLTLTLPSSPLPTTPTQQNQSAQEAQTLSLAAVAAHATATDCWTVIDDTVYDISGYVQVHPGGQVITKACGINGTTLFNTKDGRGKPHSTTAHQLLAQFRVGTIGETITPADAAPQGPLPDDLRRALALFDDPTLKAFRLIIESGGKLYTVVLENGILTMREGVDSTAPLGGVVNTTLPKTCTESTVAARHSTKSDCWILIDGNYYDVTSYIPIHPGGQSEITPYCGGKDATSAFSTKGGSGGTHSTFARSTLASFKVGTACVAQNATSPLTVSITAPTNGQQLAVGTTQVTLSAVTNRAATCKWDTKSKAYAGMTGTFDTTGGTSHTTTVTGLADASSYTRYVACKSTDGVESAIASIAFSVAAPLPTGTLDMVEVATHNSQSDCWIVIDNNVYDVTSYIPIHPGGQSAIASRCGTDATNAFNTKGGGGSHSSTARSLLATFLIGPLVQTAAAPPVATITAPTDGQQLAAGTTQTTLSVTTNKAATCKWGASDAAYASMTSTFSATGNTAHSTTLTGLADGQSYARYVRCQDTNGTAMTTSVHVTFTVASPAPPAGTGFTLADVAAHNTQNDCWIVVSNKVYSVASYIPIHPGGPTRIINVCGTDATTPFNTRGGTGSHSTTAKNLLAGFYVGDIAGTGGTGNTTGGGTGGGAIPTVEEAIQAAYPGATIQEINEEDDGRKEVKIRYQGNEMTVHLDANNNIV